MKLKNKQTKQSDIKLKNKQPDTKLKKQPAVNLKKQPNAKLKEQSNMDFKKQFEQKFNSLCQNRTRFTTWNDCVHMWAYVISNACNFRKDREDKYMNIINKYSKQEALIISELFALLVLILDEDREQDFLGQFYMDNNFGDVKKGQYFTPYDIAYMMCEMVSDYSNSNSEPKTVYATINDPTCGTGVMLIAYINKLIKDGYSPHVKALIVATDLDPCIALMCYIQLSLFGAAGYICIRNTLTEPMTNHVLYPPEDAFITPLFFHPIWAARKLLSNNEVVNKQEDNMIGGQI